MKLKQQLQLNYDRQMEYYAKFMDFIYDNIVNNDLSESDIQKLDDQNLNSSLQSTSNEKISKFSLKPTNNKNYYPLQGA